MISTAQVNLMKNFNSDQKIKTSSTGLIDQKSTFRIELPDYSTGFQLPTKWLNFWWKPHEKNIEDVRHKLLEDRIEGARYILDLEDNWDGEGSQGYREETFQKATRFLEDLVFHCEYVSEKVLPEISHGPEGSIDLHWKTKNRELLVNIPASSETPPDFYGDNFGEEKIKGTLDLTTSNEWLLSWLFR